MKSTLSWTKALVLLAVVVCVFGGTVFGQPWDGSGTPNDPYLIYTAADMQAIGADSNYWDAHFKLMADVDLSGYTGNSFNIIGRPWWDAPFTGVFDGNGHVISNFTWSSSDYSSYIALFGRVYTGEIRNLGMENVDVNVISSDFVAGLVGFNQDGMITDCYVSGTILAPQNAGGVVGFNDGAVSGCSFVGKVAGTRYGLGGIAGISEGPISNCYSAGEVSGDDLVGGLVGSSMDVITNCYSSANVTGTDYVAGGLVGESWAVTISNCYATGEVSGDYGVGGLSGYSWGCTISNCYATGAVDGNDEAGGLVGHDYNNSYSKCFWDSDVNPDVNGIGNGSDPNVIGESTVNMQTESTFTDAGWDFNTPIWKFCSLPDYPKLGWEECPEAATLLDVVSTMLDPNSLKNENMKNALLNKINAVLQMINEGQYEGALNKLENDILQKTDGCAETSAPDKNDWITSCDGQSQVYPLIMETIEYVRNLME